MQVVPENYKTRASVPYTFSFETKNDLFVSGDINIIVPTEIDVDSTALTVTPLATISLTNTLTVTWTESTRAIRIDNAFGEAFAAPVQVRLSIDAGLTNPYSTDPITPFTV